MTKGLPDYYIEEGRTDGRYNGERTVHRKNSLGQEESRAQAGLDLPMSVSLGERAVVHYPRGQVAEREADDPVTGDFEYDQKVAEMNRAGEKELIETSKIHRTPLGAGDKTVINDLQRVQPAARDNSSPTKTSADSQAAIQAVTSLQEGLAKMGLFKGAPTGGPDSATLAGLEKIIIAAQMRPEYQAYMKDHPNTDIDGLYGEGTRRALEAMVREGKIDAALGKNIEGLVGKGGALHDVYAPQDVGGTIIAVKRDPVLLALTEPEPSLSFSSRQAGPPASKPGPRSA
jgi:hypothetical protein